MLRVCSRVRNTIAVGSFLCALLAWCPSSLGLDPTLGISQYAHKAWKIRDGFFKSRVCCLAQTPDGYMWVGTESGLLRFDGIKTAPFRPPAGQQLPSNDIWGLLTTSDGTLWIGTAKGLASWKENKLKLYQELTGHYVYKLIESRSGTVWAGGLVPGKLCAFKKETAECYGDDGVLGRGVFGLYEDSKSNIWVGVANGLWRWRPGPPKLYPMPGELDGIQAFAEDTDGALLLGTRNGIQRFTEGRNEVYRVPGLNQNFSTKSVLRDRQGSLWIGTRSSGLVHVHHGTTDTFRSIEGLSGDFVGPFLEDREGNLWIVTTEGIDRFHDFAISTISVKQGLPATTVASVLAAGDGSVWLVAEDSISRWDKGQVTTYRNRADRSRLDPNPRAPGVVDAGLPHDTLTSTFEDSDGKIWVSALDGLSYFENGRSNPVASIPAGPIYAMAEEGSGDLWLSQDNGLIHVRDRQMLEQVPWGNLGHTDEARAVVPDPVRGGLWLGFSRGGITHVKNGQLQESYGPGNGLPEGRVNGLQLEADGALWVATESGLSRVRNKTVSTLSVRNGLPCDKVNGSIQDDSRSLWVYMACGLVRIRRPEVDTWIAAAEKNKDTQQKIQVTLFDSSDGVLNRDGGYGQRLVKSTDGRLWFATLEGVSFVDPHRIELNTLPPPVQIERILADHEPYDLPAAAGKLHLPPRIRDLQIDYTALSLVEPEKVRFRYMLEGYDRDWQDAGDRRQAFYNDLRPRNYKFRVIATNNSGVWNETGAALDFVVDPAYYQTTWFRLAIVAAFLALLTGLYQLRLRHLARQYNIRLEERVNERTRIARELHDTLLQSFQGALLKFYAVGYQLPEGSEAKESLDAVIEQVRNAIAEGRDALQGLRTSRLSSNDLAETMSALAKAIGEPLGQSVPDFRVQMEGTPQRLTPPVLDEIYQFANEALRNAFKHAQAKRIELEILYDRNQFRLRIRDDGKGIDPAVLREGGRPGHYGLTGMHERAKQVGGKVVVWSEADSGTEVELTIPAKIAYAKSPTRRWPTPW
jgi:signal transduction histidine kinase/ligand-binding sensor domain-containing protein